MEDQPSSHQISNAHTFCSALRCIYCHHIFSQRYVMAILTAAGVAVFYAQRVCLNLAIVEMAMPTAKPNNTLLICASHKRPPILEEISDIRHDWDEATQSYILLSFYLGYFVSMIPSGYLCDILGTRWVLSGGCLISSLCLALIPLTTVYFHWSLIIILRCIQGMAQGPMTPGAASLLNAWIPQTERSTIGGLVLPAYALGTMVGNLGTGYIIKYFHCWRWVFYIWAFVGLLWVSLFLTFVYSEPGTNPHISDHEKNYLAAVIRERHKIKLPLFEILKDVMVWSFVFAELGNDLTHYMIITNLPKYLNNVLYYSSEETGIICSIPQIFCFIFSSCSGILTDYLIDNKNVKMVVMRVTNTLISMIGSGLCLLIAGLLRCRRWETIAFFALGMGLKGFYNSGIKLQILEVTINHTGTLAAIVNMSSAVSGVMASYAIGQIAYQNTASQWDKVFAGIFVISIVVGVFYTIFAKAERADWDYTIEEALSRRDEIKARPWYWKLSTYKPK